MIFTGIDISQANTVTSWQKVAGAVQWVYVKQGEAEGHNDPKFMAHVTGAKNVGLPVGAYHFGRVDLDAKDDVEAFVRGVEKLDLDLWPVLDIETRNKASASLVLDWTAHWLVLCEDMLGVRPMVYTGPSFWHGLTKEAPHVYPWQEYPLWIAHYTGAPKPIVPKPWTTWVAWQHAANTIWVETDPKGVQRQGFGPRVPEGARIIAQPGVCPGVLGECDRNRSQRMPMGLFVAQPSP